MNRTSEREHCLLLLAVAGAMAFMGCSATYNSIYRHKALDATHPSITTVDAKQRAILHIAKGDVQRFCSEPSPDVFSVVAQSLSAGGSFGKSADPKSIQAALNMAFSSAEQGSTIPRTQTINMLRELMFRTCERYLNGGYNELELSVQAIRDQRLMISILAIEQLTGAVTPHPVMIGASGSANAGAGGDGIVRLDEARKEMDRAEAAHAEAKSKFDDVNGKDKVCDAIDETVKAGKELTEDQKSKQTPCNDARTALASAATKLGKAGEYYALLKGLAAAGGVGAGTVLSASAEPGIARAHSESVEKVADKVTEIVGLNFSDDTEIMLFCLKTLSSTALSKDLDPTSLASLRTTCLGYLGERVAHEERKLIAEAGESAKLMDIASADNFTKFWPKLTVIVADPTLKTKFVQDLAKQLLKTDQPKAGCFQLATKEAEYRECFSKLPSQVQRSLAGGQ